MPVPKDGRTHNQARHQAGRLAQTVRLQANQGGDGENVSIDPTPEEVARAVLRLFKIEYDDEDA